MNVSQTLEERAQRLATPVALGDGDDGSEYVTFRIADERYAVETSHVIRIDRLPVPTTIPGIPDCFLGAITLQGEIVPVIDLRSVLELPQAHWDRDYAIVLGGRGAPLALAASELDGIAMLAAGGRDEGLHHRYVHGVTRDAIVMLDVDAILEDPRLSPDTDETSQNQENAPC